VTAVNKEDDEEEEQITEALGWKWTTDPDGNMHWIHKETGLKHWESPILLEDKQKEEETTPPKRRLNKKTSEEEWLKLKAMKVED
jgi:hypothetical protein